MTCVSWNTSPVKDWASMAATQFKAGGEGKGADPDVYATILRTVLGARVKLVTGYPGSADITLAMERGELDGLCGISYSTIRSTHPDWISGKQVNILVQGALQPDPLLPGVPFLPDLAKTPDDKQVLQLLLAPQAMARPFAAPPGIPADRARALQQAFDATMQDPAFLAEAQALGLDVNPMNAAEIEAVLKTLYASPKDIVKQATAASGF